MFVNTASNYEYSDDDDDQSMASLRMGRTVHRTYMGRRSGCSQPAVIALLLISCFIFILFHLASMVPRKPVPPNFAWAANASRNITLYIRPNEPTSLLQPKNFCKPNPFILFVVPSAINNTKERVAIRRTWGQWANTHASRVLTKEESPPNKNNQKSPLEPYVHPARLSKLVFLLGKSRGQDPISSSILEESRLYGDIVVEDFVDSYTNLTLKSVFMLKWVHQNCPNVNFVMKVDDDIFVNVLNLEQALMNKTVAKTPLLLGSLICGARPIHDQWSKWYTPKYMFREGKYPNYLSGTGYVISGDIIQSLLKAALSTEYFHLEDVFITGLCARTIGVRAVDHVGFSYQPRALSACLYRDVIMGHGVLPSEMVILWNRMNHPASFEKCHPIKKSKLRGHTPTKCNWR
ncbi:beta-1,3-galactosyltransferase 1-like isoform X1 [Macrobrachium rosenbergii]|uniref:beta-1,3-galactosyltransferase 1-like isoform X1 n=2 Tax=Macrobrachium rosenbergii TaxID=79674 RepID=UPI0034D74747